MARAGAPRTRRLGKGKLPKLPADWTPRAKGLDDLLAIVERLPLEPGVYIMRDRKGRVVYVGKATKLRNRVRQYFNGSDTRDFVPQLGRLLGDIETVVTANDKEALLLENNLIKEHRPRFNVKLRDDKQYMVLRLDTRATWPRLEVVRNIAHDGARYFGPYHSASRARSTLRVVNRHFQLRTCTDHVLKTRKRPCLQFQIGRCPAPCVKQVDTQGYQGHVEDVSLFLGGKHDQLSGKLRQRMQAAAEAQAYEQAAHLRDQLRAVESTLERQQVVGTDDGDQDVFGLYREGGQVEFAVLHVRSGKLVGSRAFSQTGMEMPDHVITRDLLAAYYADSPFVPTELLLPVEINKDESQTLSEWLSDMRGRKVSLATPQRGAKKGLVELANKNASSNFYTRRDRKNDAQQVLNRLQDRLKLSRLPQRIECFDISHMQGSQTVASMVVFENGEANKRAYRSFKIRGDKNDAIRSEREGGALAQGRRQNDDFASMYEALSRRFRRALAGDDESWALPDLLVLDGGKGQLSRVLAAMADLGVPLGAEGVDVVALAKERADEVLPTKRGLERLKARSAPRSAAENTPGAAKAAYELEQIHAKDGKPRSKVTPKVPVGEKQRPERVFLPGAKDPIRLAPGSTERYLLERVRDEAHRFAITHHRKRRQKRNLASRLDEISGVGPAMKKKLLTHFGSFKALREADVAALQAVSGVGPKLAERLHASLRGG